MKACCNSFDNHKIHHIYNFVEQSEKIQGLLEMSKNNDIHIETKHLIPHIMSRQKPMRIYSHSLCVRCGKTFKMDGIDNE